MKNHSFKCKLEIIIEQKFLVTTMDIYLSISTLSGKYENNTKRNKYNH